MSKGTNSPLVRRGYVTKSELRDQDDWVCVAPTKDCFIKGTVVVGALVIDLSRREELRDKVAAAITLAQRGDSAHEIADAVLAALLEEGK